MFVFVAVGTLGEVNLVESIFSAWDVALRTLESTVLTFKWVSRVLVRSHVKQRWLPAVYRMTRGTFAPVTALRKLADVLIFVAIQAPGEGHRFLEISVHVAQQAINGLMFPKQRVLSLGVVEIRGERRT